jgi:hypothetical protein
MEMGDNQYADAKKAANETRLLHGLNAIKSYT